MALKFNVKNYMLEIDMNTIIFDEFKEIIKQDKDRNKIRAKEILLYVFLREDISQSNPIGNMDYQERIVESSRIAFKKTKPNFSKKEEEMIHKAITAYVKYSSTSEERLLKELDDQLDQQRRLLIKLNNIDNSINTLDNDAKMKKNDNYSKELKSILDNINSLIQRKKSVKDIIKGNDSGKVRADQSSSLIEIGAFKHIKNIAGK